MRSVISAISTRIGGISQYPYHTLNLAYHVGDVPGAVAENRQRFCDILDIDINSLVLAQQIHSDGIVIIDRSQAGCGAHRHEDAIPNADGMITRSRSIALAVLTADCVPMLVIDPVRKATGVAHVGWKGALRMIAAKTILKMRDTFGSVQSDCLVSLGPSIGPCCYEVKADVISQFQHVFGPVVYITRNRLDLRRAVEMQLVDIGVEESNISSEKLCTACNLDLFYSHRAEGGRTGRIISVIKLA
jgi:YfiH family protein